MQMKKNQLYARDWHDFKEFFTNYFGCPKGCFFKGLGAQNDTQKPCWLRIWMPCFTAQFWNILWDYDTFEMALE